MLLLPDAETTARANSLHPHTRWDRPREGVGRKGVGSDSCHISHARLPACKALPESRTGRGQRSCTLYFSARFLLIARLLSAATVLLSHVASVFIVLAVSCSPQEREQWDSRADVSAADFTNMHSAIWRWRKATGGVGLIFMQGCASPLKSSDRSHSIHHPPSTHQTENEGWMCVPCVEQVKGTSTIQSFELPGPHISAKYNTVIRTERFSQWIHQMWWSRNFTFWSDGRVWRADASVPTAPEHHY